MGMYVCGLKALLEFMVYLIKKINKKGTHFEQPPKRSSNHFGHVVLYTSSMTMMVFFINLKVEFLIGHFDL
jgi:hypothetical protein